MKPPIAIHKPKRTFQHLNVLLSIGLAVVGMVGARGLTSLTQIVLARWMGVELFGTFASMYALLSPLVIVAGLGLDTWLLRQGGAQERLDEAIGHVLTLRVVSLAALLALVIAALVVSGWPPLAVPIVLATLGLGGEFFVMTGVAALRSQLRNHTATMIQVIVAALWLWLVWQFWNMDAPLVVATGYRLLAAATGAGALIWLLRHTLQRGVWQMRRFVPLVRQSRAFFAADVLANVAMRADLMLVAILVGAVGAGIYSPALTIVNTSFLVPTAVWYVVVPIAARHNNDRRALRRMISLLLVGSCVFGLSSALVFGLGAETLITHLFSAQYIEAVPLLQIMAFIPLLKCVNFCWALIMVVRDAEGLRARLLAGSTAFNIVANLIAIPMFGVTGAAWINLMTEVVLVVCYGCGAWRSVDRSGRVDH